jgi:hypothetical protein
MSCDAAAALAFLWLASTSPAQPAAPAAAPPSVAQEPLFADIVQRAGALKAEVDAFRGKSGPLPADFKARIAALADLDLQGHLRLKERGVDGDLKCILKGISQDLPVKLNEVETAADPGARDAALLEMSYLLRDNVEVISAPPAPPV